ncbi:MAG: DUF4340 domain-containing protein [Clostridia bacterium]|nr:DUF4340 domain-containing protein [Clostridia bacterium]
MRTVDAADITGFILGGEDESKGFHYTDKGWVYNSLDDFPLSADFMHSALQTLSLIDAVEVVAEGVSDLSPYGLDTPKLRLSVIAEETHSYLIGDYNSYNGFYYFMEENGDTVFLIDADLPMLCRSDEAEFVSLGRLPDNFADGSVKRVQVDGTSYTDEALLTEVSTVALSEYHGYDPNGLDNPHALLIDYSAATADSYGTAAYGIELDIKAEGEYLLFTYGADGIVYRLDKAKYPELTKIIE